MLGKTHQTRPKITWKQLLFLFCFNSCLQRGCLRCDLGIKRLLSPLETSSKENSKKFTNEFLNKNKLNVHYLHVIPPWTHHKISVHLHVTVQYLMRDPVLVQGLLRKFNYINFSSCILGSLLILKYHHFFFNASTYTCYLLSVYLRL